MSASLSRPAARAAFTLVELLVVIAIIVILLGLLMPALQMVRELANKTVCASQLGQIGKGLQAYVADRNQTYPTGGGDVGRGPGYQPVPRGFDHNGAPAVKSEQDWGWMYQILPYVEKRDLWALRKNAPAPGPDLAGDMAIQETVIPFYFCPTRRSPEVINNTGGEYNPFGFRAANDYAGNMGGFTIILNGQFHEGCANSIASWGGNRLYRSGIFIKARFQDSGGQLMAVDSLIGPRDVTDGLGYTIMAGEKRLNRSKIGQPQLGDATGWVSGFGLSTLRNGGFPPMRDADDPFELVADQFGSAHPRSSNFLFCDGSVRQIRHLPQNDLQVLQVWVPPMSLLGVEPLPSPPNPPNSMPQTLFQRLCHRNDGGTVDTAKLME